MIPAPFGYRWTEDGLSLLEHAGEQRVLVEARRLRAAGLSFREIAAELNARGFRARAPRADPDASAWLALQTRAAVGTFHAESEGRTVDLTMREMLLADALRRIARGDVKLRLQREEARDALACWIERVG